mmetsp:Transcript_1085/g.1216  ORF Transcript_1085/g.1216 Transcript_1085/m.1216 type:complete len:274 (-) Transcript_1085:1450-2271(-)
MSSQIIEVAAYSMKKMLNRTKLVVHYIGIENFESYDMTEKEVISAGLLFTTVLMIYFYAAKSVIKEQKRLGWIISLLNSLVMTILGVIYLSAKLPIFENLFLFGETASEIFHERTSNFSAMTCLWFAIANILDICLGLIYYKKYLGLLTAYIHHSVFIWTMYACTTGDGIFMTIRPFSGTFCICLIEEVPTFLLALGSVFPVFRTDYGFGLTFFLLRILYHAYFAAFAFRTMCAIPVLVLFICTFTLHFFWFKTWINKYGFFAEKISAKKIKK